MSSSIRSKFLTDAVLARLTTLVGVTVYRSEVDTSPPVLPDSGRVGPYVVVYPFPGKPGQYGQDLGNTGDDLEYTCQLTCAAGFATDCEALVDRVHHLMYVWAPTIAGIVLGTFVPPPGYDPGPVRADTTITPPRFSVPLQYRLTATAN